MKKIILYILLSIFIVPNVFAITTSNTINMIAPVDDGVCTMEFAPVCAEVQIQCIKAPCNPILQTFSNKCQMSKNKLAKFLYNGECKGDITTNPEIPTEKCLGATNGAKCGSGYGQEIPITNPCLLSDNESRRICASSMMREADRTKIEEYVKNNISKISNKFGIKEVLGGTFFITKMSWVFEDNLNLLQVEYEDGHVAYVANLFAFINLNEEKSKDNTNKYGIKVDLFYLVKDNGKEVNRKSDNRDIIEKYVKENITTIAKNYKIESGYGKQFYVIGIIDWINDNNLKFEFGDGYNNYVVRVTAHLDPSKQGTDIVKIDNLKIDEKKIISQEIKTNINENQIIKKQTVFSKIRNFFMNIFKSRNKN